MCLSTRHDWRTEPGPHSAANLLVVRSLIISGTSLSRVRVRRGLVGRPWRAHRARAVVGFSVHTPLRVWPTGADAYMFLATRRECKTQVFNPHKTRSARFTYHSNFRRSFTMTISLYYPPWRVQDRCWEGRSRCPRALQKRPSLRVRPRG